MVRFVWPWRKRQKATNESAASPNGRKAEVLVAETVTDQPDSDLLQTGSTPATISLDSTLLHTNDAHVHTARADVTVLADEPAHAHPEVLAYRPTAAAESNCFAMIEPVLCELRDELASQVGNWQSSVCRSLSYLMQAYNNNSKVGISYSGLPTEFAYLYRYAPTHSSMLCSVLSALPEIDQLLRNNVLNVVCLGGGPGTDVLGLLKLCHRKGSKCHVNATVLDKELGWERCWRIIEAKANLAPRASIRFKPVDLLTASWTQCRPEQCDLITVSYCFSELLSSRDAPPLFDEMFSSIKPGTIIAIVDNGDSYAESRGQLLTRHESVESLIAKHGLHRLKSTIHAPLSVDSIEWESAKHYRETFQLWNWMDGDNAHPLRRHKAAYWILSRP